ncbi:MAG TPA: RluA family pseudouridine synthase [Caulobacteraceae bacterium]|nr:RluA family pseudouridine synthase [Caulobacteraceae bacterium]
MNPKAPIKLSADEIALVRSMVLYEDAEVLVLNKPAGLSSQGGRGQANTLDELLWAFAKSNGNRPRLVHRLDRDTSGVILTARTKPAAGFLGKALMNRKFRKTYNAIVTPGPPAPPSGVIEAPLRRVEQGREVYMRVCEADHPEAESAKSVYRTLAAGPDAALLEMEPHTGRMHQLRVHLASIGRPIVGDARYGGALMAAGLPAPRVMLHAALLGFPHPAGGTKWIKAPLPDDFSALLAGLGLADDQAVA